MTRQYIGARYVTKIYENSQNPASAEWEAGINWEPLIVVTYNNGSYMSKKFIPASVGNPADNPTYWTQTGFYNGQIASLQAQIDSINNKLSDMDNDIDLSIKHINANIILDGFVDANYWLQGACYVGNNKIVAYHHHGGATPDDTGLLRCYNIATHSLEWEHSLTLYHGNSICYKPSNNKIYVCACIDSNDVPQNDVFVINLDNPSIIENVIAAPVNLTNIAYDSINDVFYGSNTDGQIIKFSGEFVSVDNTITLDTPLDDLVFSVNTCGLIVDGVVYSFGYMPEDMFIVGNDIITGKRVYMAQFPSIINGYRHTGELENLIYNFDDESFISGSMLMYNGVYQKRLFTFAEAGLYKTVNEIMPYNYRGDQNLSGDYAHAFPIYVDNGGSSLIPINNNSNGLKCIDDAITASKNIGYANIYLGNTSDALDGVILGSFSGLIQTYNGITDVYNIFSRGNNKCALVSLHFKDAPVIETGWQANVYLSRNDEIGFQNCEFDSFTPDTNGCHIFLYPYSKAILRYDNTFNGSLDLAYQNYNSEVIYENSFKWTDVAKVHSFTSSDYEDIDLSFNIPANNRYLIYLTAGFNSNGPRGYAITGSTATNVLNPAFIFEEGSLNINATPTFIIDGGSAGLNLKIWAKRAGASDERTILHYKAI